VSLPARSLCKKLETQTPLALPGGAGYEEVEENARMFALFAPLCDVDIDGWRRRHFSRKTCGTGDEAESVYSIVIH